MRRSWARKTSAPAKSSSFIGLLSRNMLLSSLLIILAAFVVFLLANWLSANEQIKLTTKGISGYAEELGNGNYSSIPVSRVLGGEGWLEIVDTNGRVIYSSLAQPNTYTVGELDCIQRYGSSEIMHVSGFETETNRYHYLITKTFIGSEEEQQYLLLNEHRQIIAGTISTNKTQFSQREFDLLVFNADNNSSSLTKYAFTNSAGTTFYAITLDTMGSVNFAPMVILGASVLALLALYILLLFFSIRHLSKKVRDPLAAMEKAMTGFAKDGYRARLNYKGAREFEQLTDSFNEMVSLLNASEEEKSALEQDRQRMLSGLSHDLKTPITVIQGFAKALRDGIISPQDEKKYLDIIINKSALMGDLVNTFYEYSKLDHPDFTLNKQICDVAELTRIYFAKRYDEFEVSGYYLDAEITDESLPCSLDIAQARRVFDNLVSNFFKYNPVGKTLFFSVKREGERAHIIVADNGVGIVESARSDIFKPFVVGDESRNKQGSGLGLAVCQKIISAHGGTISLSDTPLEGFVTQFDIMVPLLFDEIPQSTSKPTYIKQNAATD